MVVITGRVEKTHSQRFILGSKLVSVYVGDSREAVPIHHNVITQSSSFFQKALNGLFREKEGVVHLPEQRKELIEIYVEWLYFGTIGRLDGKISPVEKADSRWPELYDLYLLADVLQDHKFANAVMDAILHDADTLKTWPTGLASSAWTELPVNAPMRRYIMEQWVTRSISVWFGPQSGDFIDAPKEFWIEVAKLYANIREKKQKVPKPAWATRCRYHYHKGGESCT